ncbi:MAG: hypothetical protein LWY06_12530 [Firmicutes bacterium]|nr:hypothetical protein [Bacillota bacterium]
MKTYEILRMHERKKPISRYSIFINKFTKSFFSLACTLIVDGDKYTIEGPDEEAVNFLRSKLEEGKGYLGIPTGGFDANGNHWHGWIPVHFTDEKRFGKGIEETLYFTSFTYRYPEMKLEPVD